MTVVNLTERAEQLASREDLIIANRLLREQCETQHREYQDALNAKSAEIGRLEQMVHTLGAAVTERELALHTLRRQLAKKELSASCAAALIEWLINDADVIVLDVDGEPEMLVFSGLEDPGTYSARLSKYIAAVLYGGDPREFFRPLCSGCKELRCHGCDGETLELVIPRKVSNLLREVRS